MYFVINEENIINSYIAAARNRGAVCSEMTALDILFYRFLTGNLFVYNYVPEETKEKLSRNFPQHLEICEPCRNYDNGVRTFCTTIELVKEFTNPLRLKDRGLHIDSTPADPYDE